MIVFFFRKALVWAASRRPRIPRLSIVRPKDVLEGNVTQMMDGAKDPLALASLFEAAVRQSEEELCKPELKNLSWPVPELDDRVDIHWNNSLTLSKLKNVLSCCLVDKLTWTKMVQR